MLHRNVKATEAPVFDQSFADAGACVPFLLPIPTAAGAAEEPRGSSRVARDHSQNSLNCRHPCLSASSSLIAIVRFCPYATAPSE